MNKCVNLRFRSKKGIIYQYCTKQRREIPKNGCIGCKYKEYKKYKHKITNKKRIKVSDETYKKVLYRDRCCRLCGNKNINELVLHHIYYRSERKDLIDEPSNCIMLCGNFTKNKCHQLVHNNKKKYQPYLLELIKK